LTFNHSVDTVLEMGNTVVLRTVPASGRDTEADTARLNEVFFALCDPVRRRILERLDGEALLVSELAMPFDISLQAVSRHIQLLVRAGLVQQERSGRISRCSLEAQPLAGAALWLNRYSKYWQQQFDVLAATLADIDERATAKASRQQNTKRTSRGKRRAMRNAQRSSK
jgi:DNA-binding transcriptional ArsR family regulator